MKGDEREEVREHKNAANPIQKSTLNRKWNDEGGPQEKRLWKKCNQPKQCDKRIEEREKQGYREPNPKEYIRLRR